MTAVAMVVCGMDVVVHDSGGDGGVWDGRGGVDSGGDGGVWDGRGGVAELWKWHVEDRFTYPLPNAKELPNFFSGCT